MINENITRLVSIHNDINLILKDMIKYETLEEDPEYEDLIRDLEWDKKMLQNKLTKIKMRERE